MGDDLYVDEIEIELKRHLSFYGRVCFWLLKKLHRKKEGYPQHYTFRSIIEKHPKK